MAARWHADLTACNNYANGAQAAPLIKARVQVIVAGKDRMAPKKATDALIAHLPDEQAEAARHYISRLSETGMDGMRQTMSASRGV